MGLFHTLETVNRFFLAYTLKKKKFWQITIMSLDFVILGYIDYLSFHHRALLSRRDLGVSQHQEKEKTVKSQAIWHSPLLQVTFTGRLTGPKNALIYSRSI